MHWVLSKHVPPISREVQFTFKSPRSPFLLNISSASPLELLLIQVSPDPSDFCSSKALQLLPNPEFLGTSLPRPVSISVLLPGRKTQKFLAQVAEGSACLALESVQLFSFHFSLTRPRLAQRGHHGQTCGANSPPAQELGLELRNDGIMESWKGLA